MITRSFKSNASVAIKIDNNGTDRLANGIRRKITQPLTMMLKPIIARTICINDFHFVLVRGD